MEQLRGWELLSNPFLLLLSCQVVFDSAIPWTAACQASLSFTLSPSSVNFMSLESVMPSNCLMLHHSFLLLPSIFPSIRVFPNESAICIRWPKCQETGMRMGKHAHFLEEENLKCEILKGHLVLWVPNICSQVSSLKSSRILGWNPGHSGS